MTKEADMSFANDQTIRFGLGVLIHLVWLAVAHSTLSVPGHKYPECFV